MLFTGESMILCGIIARVSQDCRQPNSGERPFHNRFEFITRLAWHGAVGEDDLILDIRHHGQLGVTMNNKLCPRDSDPFRAVLQVRCWPNFISIQSNQRRLHLFVSVAQLLSDCSIKTLRDGCRFWVTTEALFSVEQCGIESLFQLDRISQSW